MTRIQLNERDRLVSKHQAALLRFPKLAGPEFSRELQAIVRDLESLALEADASSNNAAERARTWSYVSAVYFDLAAGDPELERRAATARSRAEQLVPTSATDQVEQLRSILRESVEQGKVRSSREGLLEDVVAELKNQVQRTGNTEPELRDVRSRLTELMKSMSHLVRDPSEGGPPMPPESRGALVWAQLVRLKLALVEEIGGPRHGSEEGSTGIQLSLRCAKAGTALYKAHHDADEIRALEEDLLRPLALEIRSFLLRGHLGVANPALPVSPVAQDPNSVFFAGGDGIRSLLTEVCRERGLNMLGQVEHGDPAQTRWDQLRASNVAVFELDASLAPTCYDLGMALALGRAVVVIAPAGSKPPFDVDVEPLRISAGDSGAGDRLSQALDAVLYGPQRVSHGSSVEPTLGWLGRQLSSNPEFRVSYLLKRIGEEGAARDAITARRSIEHLLAGAGPEAPVMIFPSWPMSYPDPSRRMCFHVMPFGPEWSTQMMNVVSRSCQAAKVEYVRGDQVLDPRIILSIWNSICTATHIVVDLTGLNPNVALELGVARTLGRNVLLMTQDTSRDWSFTVIDKVRMHRYSIRDEQSMRQLRETLKAFLC